MNKSLDARYSLRNALPAALLLIVVALLLFSYLDSVGNGRAEVRQRAREDLVLAAEHLARDAQRELKERPSNVESDLAVASTERRSTVLALIDHDGTVIMAQRLAWRGQSAPKSIAQFSMERFQRVIQGRIPDVQEYANPPRVSVMVPFLLAGNTDIIRNDDRGVVYQEFDLRHDYDMVQWEAQQRMWPLLVAALLTAMALARLIRAKVTRPLAQVEQASLSLAQQAEFPAPLEITGPREIARLAHGFNVMVERIQHAQHDSESSRARLAAIVDAAMDAIITVDSRHNIMVINAAALTMFGCREQEMLGQPIHILLPERYRKAHKEVVQGFAQTRGTSSRSMGRQAVVTGRRMNGEEFPAEASISNIQVDGETLLTVILRDVTERQKAQDAILSLNSTLEAQVQQRTAKLTETAQMLEAQQRVLQAAHEEQRTIFDTVTVGIALLKDRVILRCNRKLEEVFGYEPGALDGQATRCWYPSDAAHQAESVRKFTQIELGHVHQVELELIRKDGSLFMARMTGSRYVDAHLDSAVLVVLEDMSLQHAAKQAIVEAKEKAVEASQAKSHFLANMSHEIRTPMNAIIGLSYLMQKGELNSRQREKLQKIQLSSQHLLGIINDVLDYSKIEAGKLLIERTDFALSPVLDNASNLVSDKAHAKGLALHFQIDGQVPQRLVGDPLRLGQIIVNYMSNAVKFTPKGSVKVHVGLREESGHDVLLYCSVTDTGLGVSAAQQATLFQSFQQADSSITREFGGTGLGLAICKQLASLMHGEVGVDSVPGQGSTFWFTARLEKSREQSNVLQAARSPTVGAGLSDPLDLQSLHGARVLLVEDNALNREVAGDLLADVGIMVDMALDGQSAVQCVQQQRYDLVLMDMQMPVMDGITATRLIRQLPGFAGLPIIAMTANAMASDRQACLDAGMNDHVAKPIEPERLFHTLGKWLQLTERMLPAAPPAVTAPPVADGVAMPVIEGLDTEGGLHRVRGKRTFYLSLLRKYAAGQKDTLQQLRQEVQDGLRPEAQRRAHNLKSLSASIGLDHVSQQAAQLEAGIKNGVMAADLEPDLQALQLHLNAFLLELARQLPLPADATGSA